ncbi:hypothetical protein K502DRAFT_318233 [Neoconidiobolus thromboides FSU 785]|nr:hypothetical protein K502DRAFT_318233 [Neoconidiobolus thromboides FSU 785]
MITFRSVIGGIYSSVTKDRYTLALSGGYEDDIDEGDRFIYTRLSGRDLKGTKNNP